MVTDPSTASNMVSVGTNSTVFVSIVVDTDALDASYTANEAADDLSNTYFLPISKVLIAGSKAKLPSNDSVTVTVIGVVFNAVFVTVCLVSLVSVLVIEPHYS